MSAVGLNNVLHTLENIVMLSLKIFCGMYYNTDHLKIIK